MKVETSGCQVEDARHVEPVSLLLPMVTRWCRAVPCWRSLAIFSKPWQKHWVDSMAWAPSVDGFNRQERPFSYHFMLKEAIFGWWMVVATQRSFSFTDSVTLDMFFQDGKKGRLGFTEAPWQSWKKTCKNLRNIKDIIRSPTTSCKMIRSLSLVLCGCFRELLWLLGGFSVLDVRTTNEDFRWTSCCSLKPRLKTVISPKPSQKWHQQPTQTDN